MASNRSKAKKPDVRAAGGLVWRPAVFADPSGATADTFEVVLIHRPRYDDWSFPKGKLDRRESSDGAARREVEEETGLRCELGDELPPARYMDGKGRLKEVRYWAMRAVGISPWSPNDEVDRRRWVSIEEATELLTYEHDRELLDAFAEAFRERPEVS
jgi:8-oxo-dGTP pyrophosphatase MutT (NUDIX family)